MTEPREPEDAAADTSPNYSQWLREGMTATISLVILVLAAVMMLGTFRSAQSGANQAEQMRQAQEEAYNRQKDIMLYALALLGTVTGYDLGRVPAELHAQQAQRSANAANRQLQKSQSVITETAVTAARTATQLGQAEADKAKAVTRLRDAQETLRSVNGTISEAIGSAVEGRRDMAAEAAGARDVQPDTASSLRDAQRRIEKMLARLESE